jgi:hypothetical protein
VGLFAAYGRPGIHESIILDGATSLSQIKDHHPAFYFYLPEGLDASDFVLIKLSKKSDKRQFQVQPAGGGGKSVIKQKMKCPSNPRVRAQGHIKSLSMPT